MKFQIRIQIKLGKWWSENPFFVFRLKKQQHCDVQHEYNWFYQIEMHMCACKHTKQQTDRWNNIMVVNFCCFFFAIKNESTHLPQKSHSLSALDAPTWKLAKFIYETIQKQKQQPNTKNTLNMLSHHVEINVCLLLLDLIHKRIHTQKTECEMRKYVNLEYTILFLSNCKRMKWASKCLCVCLCVNGLVKNWPIS